VPVSGNNNGGNNSEYRTKIDSLTRIFSKGESGKGPNYSTVEMADGSISYYGNTDNSVVISDDDTVISWLPNKTQDNMRNENLKLIPPINHQMIWF
jgi:hypothetical protein